MIFDLSYYPWPMHMQDNEIDELIYQHYLSLIRLVWYDRNVLNLFHM